MEETQEIHLDISKDLFTNAGRHFIGILSPKTKHLLTLPLDERTGGAFSDLLSELEDIKFFKRFSNRKKELLAKKLTIVSVRADEYLLRQGDSEDPPQAMYVIVNGVISVQHKIQDSLKAWPEKILQKGDFFGHEDIVRDGPPSVDVMTVGYSELLMLKKEDFHIVHEEMEAHSSRVEHYLRTTEAIVRLTWTDEEYQVLEIYSKLATYAENMEVYGGVEDTKPFWSYFVVSGECRVVRELLYSVADMKTLPYETESETKNPKQTREALEFEEVKQGYYFGVGEHFGRNKIVANSTLECLLIPRLLLVFKNKPLLRKMASDLTASLPSDQEVLDSHAKLMSACKKKVDMFKNLFKDKPERLVETE